MRLNLLAVSDGRGGYIKTDLARELSSHYVEILVDEYQDINEAQDMIFRAISADENNLFTVGDVKQSIYRFRQAMPEIFLERGLSFRPQLWADAVSQAAAKPWFGYGYDSKFIFDIPEIGRLLSDPHNVELAVLLELGAIGLILWLVMYGAALFRCLQQRRHAGFQIASALLVYGIAAGLTEGSSYLSRPNESWFLIWIPLSLVAALSIQQRQLDNR